MNAIETIHAECGEEATGRIAETRRHPSLPEEWDHRLADRHDRLIDRLPRIRLTLLKVADAHASHHPELNRLLRVFTRFADELLAHMGAEERELVPLVCRVEQGEAAGDDLGREVRGLEADHTRLAAALDEIDCLTAHFTCPTDVCDTYRMLMSDLQNFAAALRGVIAEEDATLFTLLRIGGEGAGGRLTWRAAPRC